MVENLLHRESRATHYGVGTVPMKKLKSLLGCNSSAGVSKVRLDFIRLGGHVGSSMKEGQTTSLPLHHQQRQKQERSDDSICKPSHIPLDDGNISTSPDAATSHLKSPYLSPISIE